MDALPPDDLAGDEARPEELTALGKLMLLASAEGDLSPAFSDENLAKLGADVVADYERDKGEREGWEKKVRAALDAAAQEGQTEKTYPWDKASNVKYPMLTVASLQFNARAYPAIVKGDEAVSVKVVGKDNGRPQIGPDGQPMMAVGGVPVQMVPGPGGQPMAMAMTPMGPMPVPPDAQPEPVWDRPPGFKAARAQRVRDYLNSVVFYDVEGWEEDTDQLLMQLPIVGCAFRKVCYKDGEWHINLVPALNLIAPVKARDVKSSPRLTEEIPDVFPYQIEEKIALKIYREVDLQPQGDDEQAPRLLLEQHRLMDLDEDGISEPYIITVDKETSQVLRIESNFSPKEALEAGGRVRKLSTYYVKYDFFPNPKGEFYGIGFGHLLESIGEVVNTMVNQLIDAGTAEIAGGGFIASGVRLQGNSSSVKFRPGEYKTVNGVTGAQLKDSIWERTFPKPSTVTFQLLDLMLGAAKDISSVKDVITGEASNNGQVGTTLALIEQGLQVFTAIYKRVYRSLKEEFTMLFEGLSRYGGEAAAEGYQRLLDDPQADFATDFALDDLDIRPVSDPSSVTKMQKMGMGQFLMSTLEPMMSVGGNGQEVMRRVYEAADVEDIEKLFPPQEVPPPDPEKMAKAEENMASAGLKAAQTEKTKAETALMPLEAGFKMGVANGPDTGGLPGMAGEPGQPMDIPGGSGGV